MRILHPTDFSLTAELARTLALDLRDRLAGHLHVVHVQHRFAEGNGRPYLTTQLYQISADLQRRLEEERLAETKALRERLAHLAEGEAASGELVWGEPLPELLRLAREHDLVVMGAHGQSPFDEVFLGGTAGRLVRRTTTPVITVRQTSTTTSVRRILVATDFSAAAAGALEFAAKLATAGGIKLVLAHVMEGRGLHDTSDATVRLDALAAGRTDRIVVRQGNPVDVLPQIAQDVAADAIAVGLRRHGTVAGLIMGSRADALVRSSPVPILCVPMP
jgi:nucleotide-binding universal stress UspA family protein